MWKAEKLHKDKGKRNKSVRKPETLHGELEREKEDQKRKLKEAEIRKVA